MLTISGVVQICAIIREDVDREGQTVVFFSAYAKRDNQSDKVYLKASGKNASYLLRNLPRKPDGKYGSRKITFSGRFETYERTKRESTDPISIDPGSLDPRYGFLKQPIQMKFTKEVKEEKYIINISYLEFVDKRQDAEVVEIFSANLGEE